MFNQCNDVVFPPIQRYDILFRGKATDEQFNILDVALRSALKKLAESIQPKIYEYGFLRK